MQRVMLGKKKKKIVLSASMLWLVPRLVAITRVTLNNLVILQHCAKKLCQIFRSVPFIAIWIYFVHKLLSWTLYSELLH